MPERPRSRSFGPTVLVGLAGATLGSIAGSRDWARASGKAAGAGVTAVAKGSESAPLVVALGLVSLAAWGVVLVVRTRARRIVSVVGVLATLGMLAATLAGLGRARHDAVHALLAKGAVAGTATTSSTGWSYAAALFATLTLAAFVVAVLAAPRWPTMGTRYDAPASRADAEAAAPHTEQEMWRALDDGRDPTA